MKIKVGSWNALNALSDPERAPGAVETVRRLDADWIVLTEAFIYDHVDDGDLSSFEEEGYHITSHPYNDALARRDERYPYSLMVLSRLAVTSQAIIRTGTRDSLLMDIPWRGSETVQAAALHLDDRTEASRLAAVTDLIDHPKTHIGTRTVLAGDFNAMHGDSLTAGILRSRVFGYLGRAMPNERMRSICVRAHQMAYGTTMQQLEFAGLQDADPESCPTRVFIGRTAVAQLDHIMRSRDLGSEGFTVHQLTHGLSDHLPITAHIRD